MKYSELYVLNNKLEEIVMLRKNIKDNFYYKLEQILKSYNAIYYVREPYKFYVSLNNNHDICFSFVNGLIEFLILGDALNFINKNSNNFKSMELAISLMNNEDFNSCITDFYNAYSKISEEYNDIKFKLNNYV